MLVIAPSSLLKNWVKEIKMWLGSHRLNPLFVGDGPTKETKQSIETFVTTPILPLLIISYEQLRKNAAELSTINYGLIICDEVSIQLHCIYHVNLIFWVRSGASFEKLFIQDNSSHCELKMQQKNYFNRHTFSK